MEKHPLHEEIGKLLKKFAEKNKGKNVVSRLDPACGGEQQIPLFLSSKALSTRLCCVDAMLLKNGKVAAVIEIEESNVKPTQICGKYLTAALSKEYSHDNEAGSIAIEKNSVHFIQILNASSLKPETKKEEQFLNIEAAIKGNLCGCVKSYDIICIDWEKEKHSDKLENELYRILDQTEVSK